MRSFAAYTAARVLLFAVAFGVVYLLGARDWLAIVLALLSSGLASYVLLTRQRDAMSQKVADGIERAKSTGRRLSDGAAREDGKS